MKILAVSDEESPSLYEYYTPEKLKGYDLILSCGDLRASYLSFLVTGARCPLLYVHGNHDDSFEHAPPEGCDCIDDQLVIYRGVRILGLGGCPWYHPGKHQFTEAQMRHRVAKLRRKVQKAGGVDIVVTHAPPRKIGDLEDAAHQGFEAFWEILNEWRPKYLLHGHVHLRYTTDRIRERTYRGVQVINTCERYELELPDRPYDEKHKYDIIQVKTLF